MSTLRSLLSVRVKGFRRVSLQRQFAIMLIIWAVMAAGNVVTVQSLLARLSGVAEVVNMAGKLRMLSQKIAFEELASWHLADAGDGLEATLDAYERGLDALEHGGEALGLTTLQLPLEMQPLVVRLRTDWTTYREGARGNRRQRDASAMQIDILAAETARLLSDAETLVSAITLEAKQAKARIQVQLSLLFVAELVIFIALIFIVRRRILVPLCDLTHHHRGLAEGGYTNRMEVKSGDEIGELAAAFNFAAQTIADLMHRNALDNAALDHSASMFQGLAENSIVGVYIAQDGKFVFANQRMADMFGYEREQFTDAISLIELIDPEDHEIAEEQVNKRLSGEASTVIYEVRGRKSNGVLINLEIYGSAMTLNGRSAVIGVMLDVTARHAEQDRQQREYVERLQYQATHDELTGLANRKLFLERLNQATTMAQRSGAMVGVLLLDLNKFKIINDSLGHHAGDDLLRAVGKRLQNLTRETDTVARLGGDEFVVLLPNMTTSGEAVRVAQRIICALGTVINIRAREVHIGTSIGISLYPQDGKEHELLKNADLAMYQAKREGGNEYRFYATNMDSQNQRHMELVDELHHALERNELTLAYQPKWNLRTERIEGAEALLRWQHPRLGNISPSEFIPLAEETGLINPLGEWVMQTACAQNRAWQQAGLPAFPISINLSAKQLRSGRLVGLVRRVLEQTGLDGRYLDLELTESVLIHDLEATTEVLVQLKMTGVGLSMDDFGTGYSSLGYLMRLPFDTLKLDRSFISGLGRRPHARTLTQAIITLAHNLGLKVVAEGIETEGQFGFLRESGCDQGQGYYFSAPVPADAFCKFVTERMSVAVC